MIYKHFVVAHLSQRRLRSAVKKQGTETGFLSIKHPRTLRFVKTDYNSYITKVAGGLPRYVSSSMNYSFVIVFLSATIILTDGFKRH